MRHAAVRKKSDRRGAFIKGDWQRERMNKFAQAVKDAGAARAVRISLGVTLQEVADFYGYTYSATPGYWESGKYFGWTQESLEKYFFDLRRVKNARKGS